MSTENDILVKFLLDDGTFPNNALLPLLVYRKALQPAEIEETFIRNGWEGTWRNGIYDYHHYHSTAHEVLGVARGKATVQFGGEEGLMTEVEAGDIVVIPAGVAHKNLGASEDFEVIGAYPEGERWDMNYGRAGERPNTDRNIDRVPLPETDPVHGKSGPLFKHWVK